MHAARRRRGRDGFARTRDGRAPRSEGPGRRGAGGRPLTNLPLWWRLFGRGLRFVSDDTLGRGDAAARGDRHPGFGRPLFRPGRGPRGVRHPWTIGTGQRRGLLRLLLIGLVGPQDGWALGRRRRRLPGCGGLVTDRLVNRLRGLRRRELDHRRRGRRLQQTVARCPSPDAVGLGFDNARGVGLDPDAEREAKVERLLIGQRELLGELMDADLAWQSVPPSGPCRAAARPGSVPRTRQPRLLKPIDLDRLNVSPEGPRERSTAPGRVQAGNVVAQPGTAPRPGAEAQSAARVHAHPPQLRAGPASTAADAGANGAQTLSVRSAGISAPLASGAAWSWAAATAQARALTASPPSAGRHSCSPVAGSVIHSPSAHSTSP